jgi:hypothetical protein
MKSSHRILFLSLAFLSVLVLSITYSDDHLQQASRSFYAEGEELVYKVSWFGIKIGTIRLKSLSQPDLSETVKRKAVAYIDSRSGLPFVDIHLIAYTEMDSSCNSLGYYSYEKQDGGWKKITYQYHVLEQMVIVEEASQEKLDSPPSNSVIRDTLHIAGNPIQDAISLIFLGRHLCQVRESFSFSIISNEKLGEMLFYPLRPQAKVNIDAWEKPIQVVELSGTMKVDGIFGITGDFKGWFSDDTEAIPITAEMKFFLGSVKIELEQWNRKNWNPPE